MVPDEGRASQRRESGKRGGETLTQPSGGGVLGGEELKKLQVKAARDKRKRENATRRRIRQIPFLFTIMKTLICQFDLGNC